MDMLNRLKSTVTGVLPGNPVTREFEILNHRASAGPGLLWKVFDGTKRTTKQEVSIFVFEKKLLERYSRRDKDIIVEVLKKGVSQLTKLRHPKILSVLHPLEESRESLAFATEPVFASLANVLGFHENLPSPPPADLKDHKLFDVEIKYGFMQVTEGLTFLHSSVHLVHCNLCPSSIIINRNGNWKICGFDFCIPNANTSDQAAYFPAKEWDPDMPPVAQPNLDYLAPEFALTMSCDTASDMYSVGVLFYAVFNGGKPVYECCHQLNTYKRNIEQLRNLKLSVLGSIPTEVRDHIKLLLNTEPTVRPDADQLSKIPFFEDVGVMTLQYLDTLMQRENLQKSQFFKGLPQVIGKLPKRVNLHRILPCVMKESINKEMIPFLLPNVLLIAEQVSDQEYVKYIMPHLIPIFTIQEPVQILLVFLQNMNLLLSKTPQADIKNHVLPMLYRALEIDSPQIQGLCLDIIPTFASLIEYSSMKNAIVPRIRRLCMSTATLNIRVSCLLCLGKMLEYMDKWYVLDEIFPILQEVPSREPAVLMSVLGIYKVAMSHKKLGITKDVMANKVLPSIIPLAIDSNLNLSQFNAYISVIKEMVGKVESEHRAKLEQLNSMQQEQRTLQFTEQSVKDSQSLVPGMSTEPKQETMIDKFLTGFGISSMFSSSTASTEKSRDAQETSSGSPAGGSPSSTTPSDNKLPNRPAQVNLTLEEKQRLAQQQEQQQRLKSQTPVTLKTSPTAMSKPAIPASNKPAVKDLTSTLMNTNFMNTQNKIPPQSVSPASGSAFSSSGMGGFSGTGMGGQSSMSSNVMGRSSGFGTQSSGFSQSKPLQTKPVDMSAFDNLLPSSQSKKPMNQMTQPRPPQPAGTGFGGMPQQGMMGNMGMMGGTGMMGNQGMMGTQGIMGNMRMGMQPMGQQPLMGQQNMMGQQNVTNMNSNMSGGNVKSEFDTLFG